MASLTSIRNGIATNLGNISSLFVYGYVPDSIEPPTAIVGVVESVEYDNPLDDGDGDDGDIDDDTFNEDGEYVGPKVVLINLGVV